MLSNPSTSPKLKQTYFYKLKDKNDFKIIQFIVQLEPKKFENLFFILKFQLES